MTESRIEKFTRISQEMAAAVSEMRADAADVTTHAPETAALVEELSVTCDRWSQWEEVAAVVLAHLTAAGRLARAGGMTLTAEQWAHYQRMAADPRFAELSRDALGVMKWPENPLLPPALFPATEPASSAPDFIDIVFDGPPEAVSGRFVEVENPQGAGISVGEWINRGDGFWALRIPYTSSPVVPAPTETAEGSDRLDNVRQCLVCGLEKDWRDMVIWRDADGAGHWVHPHCSPTAPAETGPWPSLPAVPRSVFAVKDRNGVEWSRRSDGTFCGRADCGKGHPDLAPFVAAEEK